jgi:hypothetical protein
MSYGPLVVSALGALEPPVVGVLLDLRLGNRCDAGEFEKVNAAMVAVEDRPANSFIPVDIALNFNLRVHARNLFDPDAMRIHCCSEAGV